MQEEPAGAEEWVGDGLLPRLEGRNDGKQDRDGKEEDAEADGALLEVEQEEGCGEEDAEE